MVPVLGVAAMAASGGSDNKGCESIAADEQAMLTRAVLDVLPAGSVREVTKSSDYDEDCEFGGTEISARWDNATGTDMVFALETAGWKRTAEAAPDWYDSDARPTGAGAHTNDNDSPNMVLNRTVDGRTLDLAVDQEGLYAIVARGPIS